MRYTVSTASESFILTDEGAPPETGFRLLTTSGEELQPLDTLQHPDGDRPRSVAFLVTMWSGEDERTPEERAAVRAYLRLEEGIVAERVTRDLRAVKALVRLLRGIRLGLPDERQAASEDLDQIWESRVSDAASDYLTAKLAKDQEEVTRLACELRAYVRDAVTAANEWRVSWLQVVLGPDNVEDFGLQPWKDPPDQDPLAPP